jgi:hypothetical protein
MVVMGLLVATIGAVVMAFRWSQGGTPHLHGRGFGFGLREGAKGFGLRGRAPGIARHGKVLGLGAFLCLHAVLLAFGGLFLAAVVGKRACWHRRHLHHGYWGKHRPYGPDSRENAHEEGPTAD